MQMREVLVLRKQNQAELVVFPVAIFDARRCALNSDTFSGIETQQNSLFMSYSDKFWDIIIEVFCCKHVTDQGSISQTGSFMTHYFSRKLLL